MVKNSVSHFYSLPFSRWTFHKAIHQFSSPATFVKLSPHQSKGKVKEDIGRFFIELSLIFRKDIALFLLSATFKVLVHVLIRKDTYNSKVLIQFCIHLVLYPSKVPSAMLYFATIDKQFCLKSKRVFLTPVLPTSQWPSSPSSPPPWRFLPGTCVY